MSPVGLSLEDDLALSAEHRQRIVDDVTRAVAQAVEELPVVEPDQARVALDRMKRLRDNPNTELPPVGTKLKMHQNFLFASEPADDVEVVRHDHTYGRPQVVVKDLNDETRFESHREVDQFFRNEAGEWEGQWI